MLISFVFKSKILEKQVVNVLLGQGQGWEDMEPVFPKLLSYTQPGQASKG